jgi:hypothetical protein
MIKLLDIEYAQVYAEEDKEMGTVKWTKKTLLTFEEYQKVYNAILDYHKKSPTKYFIADMLDQGVMPPAFRKWFQDYVLPTAVKYGLKKAAVIFDGNVFKKYYLNHIMDTGKRFGLPVVFVNSREEAIKFFKSEK